MPPPDNDLLATDPSGVPNIGFLPSGGSGTGVTSGSKSIDWSNLAGSVAPLLLSAFGNNPYTAKTEQGANQLQTLGNQFIASGGKLASTGEAAISPVLKYLTDLVGGDRTAILNATAPERGRILDQYDSAKKAVQTAPRGGGQASSLLNIGAKEASQLGTLSSTARSSAASELGALGQNLTTTGITEQQQGATDLNSALNAFANLAKQKDASNAALGKSLGAALPLILAAFA